MLLLLSTMLKHETCGYTDYNMTYILSFMKASNCLIYQYNNIHKNQMYAHTDTDYIILRLFYKWA
jgi:hypothetical protein